MKQSSGHHHRRSREERAHVFRPFTPEQLAQRAAAIPIISYPDLPVSARRADIADAIRENQVVIVSGETGSGKTTQLPKICLQLGRGVRGMIGHTQPRRLAARAVAERISEELGQTVGREPGQVIGYQVRFTDEVGPTTLVKLMTDGILLAEIQSDPLLRRYDTLIIDEAHERSLNIDFILGYIARLLPLRPDLKVIITSATIDSERFAAHFGRWKGRRGRSELIEAAPVIEVSGRTYPVEIRYRPLSADVAHSWSSSTDSPNGPAPSVTSKPDDSGRFRQLVLEDPEADLPTLGYGLGEDIDQAQAICDAVDELSAETEGDILVFLPGERDIRDTQQALADHLGPRAITDASDSHQQRRPDSIEIIPLFARLTSAEQHRIFEAHSTRRVVLATNVAETSLTVPGVRSVIDPGLARISRYSTRTKVQRLPIEAISQASANQRAGRSGRVADGLAIRLYSRTDYESRPEFTEPEILRTSLASVILQMAALGLGAVEDFPFIDPPDPRAVRDGVQLLVEIGALEPDPTDPDGRSHQLTAIGRDLARLPIDPRLGRMLIEGDANGCASEILVIVAALSIQDIRERPLDHQQAADAAHARFTDPHSDFITYLNLWRYLNVQSRDLSGSAFRRMCRSEFLHYLRWREWRDVVNQLRQMARPLDLDIHPLGEPSSVDVARAASSGGIADAAARAAVAYTESANTVDADEIHRSLLIGLLSNLGNWDEAKRDYQGARGTHFVIWPGSGLARSHPAWVMTAELVETSRLFARTVARIRPEWIEPLAASLLKHVYSEPYWSSSHGAAMAKEKILLYGITLVAERPVMLGHLDITFGGGGTTRSQVAAPGTLAGIAQGLRGRAGTERTLGDSTSVADALSHALAALGMNEAGVSSAGTPSSDATRGGGLTPPPSQSSANPDAITEIADSDPSSQIPPDAEVATSEESDPDDRAITARELAREMFIRHALVQGEWREHHAFQKRNDELLEQAHEVERRSRTHGLVADEEARVAFFDDLIPEDVVSAGHFNRWWKRQRRETPDLLVYPPQLLLPRGTGTDPHDFPDHWIEGELRLPLSYQFTPGSTRDGVTMTVPIEVLPRVSEDGTDWLVPGMLEELCTEMIRALPKAKRRLLAPAPQVGHRIAEWITRGLAGGIPTDENVLAEPADDSSTGGGSSSSTPNPADAGDPRTLDAAMSRLATWGARSGGIVRTSQRASSGTASSAMPFASTAQPGDPVSPVSTRKSTSTSAAASSFPDWSHTRPSFAEAFTRAVREIRGVDLSASDLAHASDHLPDHLRMTFIVVDGHGQELGAGPSVVHLQKTLASRADAAVRTAVRGAVAEAFADAGRRSNRGKARTRDPRSADAPAATHPASAGTSRDEASPADASQANAPSAGATLHADDLTEFPAMPLPRSIESRGTGGLLLRGFPALVPQGSAAEPRSGIRVMANPAEADHLHAFGLARLVLVRVRLSTARVTTRWTGREALMLAASPYQDTAALVADAQLASVLALVDELSEENGPSSIRTREAFDRLAAHARALHEDRVHDVLGHVVRAMEALSEVQGAIRAHPQSSLSAVVEDVSTQVSGLSHAGFLADTPAFALPHLARYLRSGAVRLNRASNGAIALERDARDMDTVHEVEAALERASELAQSQPYDTSRADTLEQARWMVQELKVSLFAQQLGTPQKVSVKRILGMVAT